MIHIMLNMDLNITWLTFEFVVLGVCREKAVREEFREGEACVLWSVLYVVPHCGLKLFHEFWGRCT